VPFGRYVLRSLVIIGGLLRTLTGDPAVLSSDEILARIESETNRRHTLLKEYSGSRHYTLQNLRFGKQAEVGVLMSYRQGDGERYAVLTRSGSDALNGIVDKVLASEAGESTPLKNADHQITAVNYRVRLLGTEIVAGRSCYVLGLAPKIKSRYLVVGKAWVDTTSYAVVRIEGQFAASISLLIGAPRISEEFIEVNGFWLPGHVRSVTSSFLLGPTELNILFSNYRLDQDSTPLQAMVRPDFTRRWPTVAIGLLGHKLNWRCNIQTCPLL
jgi:MucB/RseB N-terminal domain